jgi:hypothetical protein
MHTQCPYCLAKIDAPDRYLGKRARCPVCKKKFIVEPEKENIESKASDTENKTQGSIETSPISKNKTKKRKNIENNKAESSFCWACAVIAMVGAYIVLKWCVGMSGLLRTLLVGGAAAGGSIFGLGIYHLGKWVGKTKTFKRLYE